MSRRKLGVLLLAALTAAAAALVFVGTAAAAPAIVIHKGTDLCGMPGSDANGNLIFGGIGSIWHIVSNGNTVTLICKGTGIENDSGQPQHFTGFPCGIDDPANGVVVTTDTQATVTENGRATLYCTYAKT